MKSISCSIVILAGVYGITATLPMMVVPDQTVFPYLAFLASGVSLALGVVAWWTSLKYDR
jgi:hypothetical protein